MARPTTEERARKYLAGFEAPRRADSDPQDSHSVVFKAALTLTYGFALDGNAAFQLLQEFCARSDAPWTDAELHHKIVSSQESAMRGANGGTLPFGCLRDEGGAARKGSGSKSAAPDAPAPVAPPPKVEFDLAALKELAGEWATKADLRFLANRSALDPCEVDAAGYLSAMYAAGEKVVVFTNHMSQGQCVWPDELDQLPRGGPDGVWYLAQPVDGKYHPNPRSQGKDGKGKMSRRSAESVTAYRYLLLESDEAPPRDWLGLLVQIPLRIAAIYTSGGRSVHVLVRVDCATKGGWDREKRELGPTLALLQRAGADPGALSAVRLTRLPGCMRGRRLQKLLYLRPDAPLRPLCELPAIRDVEKDWLTAAQHGIADSDETGGQWLLNALRYYANVSDVLRNRLKELEAMDD